MLSRVKVVVASANNTASESATSFTTRTFFRTRTAACHRSAISSGGVATIIYKDAVPDTVREKRRISGNILHGSHPAADLTDGACEFWSERRTTNVYRWRQRLMPMWDRMAQTLIVFTRPQPRVFPELAFRTMALFLKMLMVSQVAGTNMLLLPGRAAQNFENVVGIAKAEAKTGAGSAEGDTKKEDAAEGKPPQQQDGEAVKTDNASEEKK